MYASMLNLILFITSVSLFIKVGDHKQIISLVTMSICGVVFVIVFFRFWWNPDPCDYFRYSFRRTNLAMFHYLIYIFTVISSIALLVALPSMSYAPVIPPFLQLIYTLAYRPYK